MLHVESCPLGGLGPAPPGNFDALRLLLVNNINTETSGGHPSSLPLYEPLVLTSPRQLE